MTKEAVNELGPIVDIWVNLVSEESFKQFAGQKGFEGIPSFFGNSPSGAGDAEELLELMDSLGVSSGVLTSGLSMGMEDALSVAEKYSGRFLIAGTVDDPSEPVRLSSRIRDLAHDPSFSLVRITPLTSQLPLNHRLYYPIYATCEELGIPVGINIGVPGPRVKSGCQHPTLLEDPLIDFPDLVIIGSHMGHPYESLLIQYMLKWPNLYLSNSAYLSKYMDEKLVKFMDSSRGKGRVLFASDHPFLPLSRALKSARDLPLSDEGMNEFLGASARRLLERKG